MTPLRGCTPTTVVLDALAAHRLTRMVTEDHLPLGPLRDRVTQRNPTGLLAEWVSCAWCASVAVSAGIVALRALAPRWWPWVGAVLASSSVTGLLTTWEQRQ